MEPTKKTPAQAEKEKMQREWENEVQQALQELVDLIPEIEDKQQRALTYQLLVALRDQVEQCPPAVKKIYNKAISDLFEEMDAVPNSMYLDDRKPKP